KGDGGRWRAPRFRADRDREALDLEVHVLPAGFQPAEGATLDREATPFYSRIVRRCGKEHVVFVLLRPEGKDDPEAFYLMENKVSNDLFAWFADRHPHAVRGSQWRRGGRADGEDQGVQNGRLPALRVTRGE